MRVGIIRRAIQSSFSMDVYADGIVSGLRAARPNWDIVELIPELKQEIWQPAPLKGLTNYYRRYWHYPQEFKAAGVDIFHVVDHSDGHYVYWLSGSGKPIIVTCHDLINFIQPQNISDQSKFPTVSRFIWEYAVKGISKADHIITVSNHTKSDVEQILNVSPKQITTIPNAVDSVFQVLIPEEKSRLRKIYGLPPEAVVLLNVGSNHPRKNVFSVLKALLHLKRRELPFHFLKAGADFTNEQKKFLEEENLVRNTTYLGKPSKTSLVNIYNAADILISPSLYEGFGITVLEAMACGTAVIAANTTSLPEVVGDAGILVDPMNTEAIAASIYQLYKEPDVYEQKVAAGLERVKCYSWEKTAESVANVYEKAINP